MNFVRKLDCSYPKVWDTWEMNGVKWMVQDLRPEDEDRALEIMVKNFCSEEVMLVQSGVKDERVSIDVLREFWRQCLSARTSLGCYAETGETRTLAGLNICVVKCASDALQEIPESLEGTAWRHVVKTHLYMKSKLNMFEYLGMDKVLFAVGLIVLKEHRGARLSARLLNAREALCHSLGVRGTCTNFTGIASQKVAAECGFITALSVSFKELAEAGLNYPKDETRCFKLMIKKYE